MPADWSVKRINLYEAPTTVADADAIADWLRDRVDIPVAVRDRFLADGGPEGDPEHLARAFARARVLNPHERGTGNEMLGIVRYEERALEAPEREGGVLYDGLAVQDALRERLPPAARPLSVANVVLLDRALGTWGDHDGRWHKRVSVLGQPALISVPGLYEAPAKPEAYYKAKQSHALLSGGPPPREVLENQIEGDFLIDRDPRTTDALQGYVLSAVHYLATGEAFCEDPECALANPHRQSGVIRAQLSEPTFCERHAELYG